MSHLGVLLLVALHVVAQRLFCCSVGRYPRHLCPLSFFSCLLPLLWGGLGTLRVLCCAQASSGWPSEGPLGPPGPPPEDAPHGGAFRPLLAELATPSGALICPLWRSLSACLVFCRLVVLRNLLFSLHVYGINTRARVAGHSCSAMSR